MATAQYVHKTNFLLNIQNDSFHTHCFINLGVLIICYLWENMNSQKKGTRWTNVQVCSRVKRWTIARMNHYMGPKCLKIIVSIYCWIQIICKNQRFKHQNELNKIILSSGFSSIIGLSLFSCFSSTIISWMWRKKFGSQHNLLILYAFLWNYCFIFFCLC